MVERIDSRWFPSVRGYESVPLESTSAEGQIDCESGQSLRWSESAVPPRLIHLRKCVHLGVVTLGAVLMAYTFIYVLTACNYLSSPIIGHGNPPRIELPPLTPEAYPPPSDSEPPPPPSAEVSKYGEALKMALRFYDAQKTGKLPATNPVPWRGDSFLLDNIDGKDLAGGYFDAGDTLKFTLPMAWSMTVMGWAISKFEGAFASTGTLAKGHEQLRWGTDWLLKTWLTDGVVTLVGDPWIDHKYCWFKPEEFDGFNLSRPAFSVDVSAGTDVVMEVTAALAAASKVFKKTDPDYAETLLARATEMYTAVYSSPTKGTYTAKTKEAGGFYPSSSYEDELQWASTWMYLATGDVTYLADALKQTYPLDESTATYFSWDSKWFGARVLLSTLTGKDYEANRGLIDDLRADLKKVLCKLLPGSSTASSLPRTQGGLLFLDQWGPIQYASSTSFLVDVYSEYMKETASDLDCGSERFAVKDLRAYAKSQVDYILGDNPLQMSYMVGYGDKYPQQLHHRSASIPMNVSTYQQCFGPGEHRFYWQDLDAPNPNTVYGAVSGGPARDDSYTDKRQGFEGGEPALSTNAPFLATLASLIAG